MHTAMHLRLSGTWPSLPRLWPLLAFLCLAKIASAQSPSAPNLDHAPGTVYRGGMFGVSFLFTPPAGIPAGSIGFVREKQKSARLARRFDAQYGFTNDVVQVSDIFGIVLATSLKHRASASTTAVTYLPSSKASMPRIGLGIGLTGYYQFATFTPQWSTRFRETDHSASLAAIPSLHVDFAATPRSRLGFMLRYECFGVSATHRVLDNPTLPRGTFDLFTSPGNANILQLSMQVTGRIGALAKS